MKKKSMLMTLLLGASMVMAIPTLADTKPELGYITDDAGILTEREWEKLEAKAEKLSEEYECGIYVFTMEDAKDFGADIEEGAKWIYDEFDLGYEDSGDGIVFALDMTERDYILYGEGDFGSMVMGQDAILHIEDSTLSYLGSDQWYQGFDAYLDAADRVLDATYNGKDISSLKASKKKNPAMGYGIAAIVGLIAAFVVTGSMKSKMKTARKAVEAKSYVADRGVDIWERQDRYTHTTRTERTIQSSGGKSGSGSRSGGSGGSGRGKF